MMPDEQEFTDPLRNLAMELTQKYVKEAVKEATKQAIRKQGVKLSKTQFNKFEDKIKSLSDQDKIKNLKEPLEEVKQTITRGGINERTMAKMTENIHEGLDSKILLGMTLGVKVGVIAGLVSIFFVAALFMFMPGNTEVIADQLVIGTVSNNTTCSNCHGTGYVPCEVCNGPENVSASMQTVMLQNPPVTEFIPETQDTTPSRCENCGGTGKVKCPKCNGDGILNPGDPGYTS